MSTYRQAIEIKYLAALNTDNMILDVVALILVIYGFSKGYRRGLINTVFDTLSLFIGIVAALKLSPTVIGLLQGILPFNDGVVFLIGLVLTFILVMWIIKFIGDRLEDVIETVQLGAVNKILGGGIMALFIAVILSYAFYFGKKTDMISQATFDQSLTYKYIEPLPDGSKALFEKVKPAFSGFWEKMNETFDSIKEKGEELSK